MFSLYKFQATHNFNIKVNLTSSQDGSIGRHGSLLHSTTSQLQGNIEQPPLRTIRNRVEWKPDNYRTKETTSTQTGGRGADAEQAGPTPTCGE